MADINEAMKDAAFHRLALFWPERKPAMCTIGMPEEMERQVRHIADEVLAAAECWRKS